MKPVITFAFLTVYWIGFSQSKIDCVRFKTGSFEIDNKDGTISTIVRTKKFQKEKSSRLKVKDKVRWISDCSFQLIPIKLMDETGKIGSDILTMTIIETGMHHYLMKVTGLGEGIEIYGKVYEKGYLNYDVK